MSRSVVAAVLILTFTACGANNTIGPTALPTASVVATAPVANCPKVAQRTVAVDHDQIEQNGATGPLAQGSCTAFAVDEEIQANGGGAATGNFESPATCTFSQILGAQKAGTITSLPQPDLFSLANAEAVCTVNGYTRLYCGQLASVSVDGLPFQGDATCNTDPSLTVRVKKGRVTVALSATGSSTTISANNGKAFDLTSGASHDVALDFKPEEYSLFDIQEAAITAGVSVFDYGALVTALPAVDSANLIVAPNTLKFDLGNAYGIGARMCGDLSSLNYANAVFFPSDFSTSTPTLRGGACQSNRAIVYGVVIYKPNHLADFAYSSANFLTGSQEQPIWHHQLNPPVNLGQDAQTILTWSGSVDSGIQANVSPGIYVAHVLYRLLPELTPRVQLVAISFKGAPYPALKS